MAASKAAMSCGRHRPYRTKADARAKTGWHLVTICRKCRAGLVLDVFLCRPYGKHWHIGHRRP